MTAAAVAEFEELMKQLPVPERVKSRVGVPIAGLLAWARGDHAAQQSGDVVETNLGRVDNPVPWLPAMHYLGRYHAERDPDSGDTGSIRRALLDLAARARDVVVLWMLEQRSTRGTAAALGCAEGTMKEQSHASRRARRNGFFSASARGIVDS